MEKMMVSDLTFQLSDVPGSFTLCLNEKCPLAEKCLHQLVMRRTTAEDKEVLHVYHPDAAQGGEDCKFFRPLELERYAKGFTSFQEEMLPRQYAQFSATLMAHFGRNAYYERRRGERLLPPAEQKVVLDVLKSVGLSANMEFDAYEYRINWIE